MLLSTCVKTIKRKSHRGDQTITTDLITTDIIACINEALRDVVKFLPKRFWFKQSTIAVTVGVVGTPAVYSLPSDCQEPINFWYNTGGSKYVLRKVDSDKEWIDSVWDPNGALQKPSVYREIGPNSSTAYKQIEVYPISDASYTVNIEYYKTKGTDLTTSELAAVIPDVPDYCLDVVEKGGLYYFLKGFDDSMQGVAKQDYMEAKLALEMADEQDRDSDVRMRWTRPQYRLPGFTL